MGRGGAHLRSAAGGCAAPQQQHHPKLRLSGRKAAQAPGRNTSQRGVVVEWVKEWRIFGTGWVAPPKSVPFLSTASVSISTSRWKHSEREKAKASSARLGLAAVARSLRATDPSERENDHAVLFRDEELEARTIHRELPQEQPNCEEWAVVRWQAVTSKRQRTHLHDGAHTAVPLQRAEVALRAVTAVGRERSMFCGGSAGWARACPSWRQPQLPPPRRGPHSAETVVRLCGNAACQVNTVRFALPSARGQG